MVETVIAIVIFIGGGIAMWLVSAFLKKTVGTRYMTFSDFDKSLKANCMSCSKDAALLKEEIVQATTEERRADMKHFKDDIHDKLSKIMGILLIIALKKEGESLTVGERTQVIDLVTGQKSGVK